MLVFTLEGAQQVSPMVDVLLIPCYYCPNIICKLAFIKNPASSTFANNPVSLSMIVFIRFFFIPLLFLIFLNTIWLVLLQLFFGFW